MRYILSILVVFTCLSVACSQEIGLQLYSLREQFPKDVPGTLDKIKGMGVKEIEGGSTYGLSAEEFKKLLDERGLVTIGVGADFDQLAKDPSVAIPSAKFYGAKYVICYWIPHKESFTKADADKAIEVFTAAGKDAAASGLSFCYHPHGFEFGEYGKGTMFDYMIKSLDKRYVNFEMDVFWVKHPGQDPVALLKKYRGRFPLLHLKDRKPGTPDSQDGHADDDTNVVLGEGDVGIAAIMKQAPKSGVKHYFIEDESHRSEEQIPQSLKFLSGLK